LFLACELRLAGVEVLVLEREADPGSPLKRMPFGRRGLSIPTVEAFYRRGLLEGLAAAGQAGHFAGMALDEEKIDTTRWPYHLPGPAGATRAADMAQLEAMLAERATALGVEIRRGVAVEGFEQADDEVSVQAGGQVFRAGWLVGCDGGRSVVRKAGGFEFAGTDPELTGYSVQVELEDPRCLPLGRHYTPGGMFFQMRPGTITMVEFDGGAFHRGAPVTLEHVQGVLRRVTGVEVTLTALHLATTWTDRARQATSYRNGRVLLAGDAAHIHSPLGGQGLNLGLGDAMNLGWKLAATVRGDAPAGLLETYELERQPVGTAILDWSRAQVALMRPSPATRALQAIIHDLVATRDGATYFAERAWGVGLRYDLGDGHPLVGRSLPDLALADGTRAGELLREGQGLVLDFAPGSPLRETAGRWGDRVRYVAGEAGGPTAMLVRPDGVVAWACEGPPALAGCVQAGDRWFARRS
jgi:2-polyprenyl-6-methoxyphenol hydroxylase-like FAD-dependent oxidoreductase